ncbi:MAG: hypothetical protein CGW95_07475 [Phenylobacterium zucineum]|nr:MAG: hypothetical protein CGW95_07475 [Phenylobacterium zucineum]
MPALQGLAFWIGHRRALYRDYPLGESALVAELCNLIQRHLPANRQLRCEVQYAELKVTSEWLVPLARMDLLVSLRPTAQETRSIPQVAIEVKRAGSAKLLIDSDFKRLAALKAAHPTVRAFLVVIAEASRPKQFVNEQGEAEYKSKLIPGTDYRYKVRRVLKASHTFKQDRLNHAQYVCLVKVLPKRLPPSPQTHTIKAVKKRVKSGRS